MAGSRTRVNCLEGSYAHHYTTNTCTTPLKVRSKLQKYTVVSPYLKCLKKPLQIVWQMCAFSALCIWHGKRHPHDNSWLCEDVTPHNIYMKRWFRHFESTELKCSTSNTCPSFFQKHLTFKFASGIANNVLMTTSDSVRMLHRTTST